MFDYWYNRKFVRCGNLEPHKEHRWYSHWWSRTRICFGVREHPWLKANPSIGHRLTVNQGLEQAFTAHKHRLELTGWGGKIGRPPYDPDERLYFSCKDGCVDPKGNMWLIEMFRWEYNARVLAPKHVDQSWPG